VNPFRLEGQKTAAFEIIEELGESPARVFIPVGNAGNITAYWRGFREFQGKSAGRCPRMHGAQANGAAPLVLGQPVKRPRTVASAIRIGNPASWSSAIAARDESRGSIEAVSDDEILMAHRRLSAEEGLLAEPASAAGVALLIRKAGTSELKGDETIVCILTGQGLKDPKAMTRGLSMPPAVEPTLDAVRRAISSPGGQQGTSGTSLRTDHRG
jgi:threonine synthase